MSTLHGKSKERLRTGPVSVNLGRKSVQLIEQRLSLGLGYFQIVQLFSHLFEQRMDRLAGSCIKHDDLLHSRFLAPCSLNEDLLRRNLSVASKILKEIAELSVSSWGSAESRQNAEIMDFIKR